MPYQLLEQLYLIDLCAGCKKIWTYLRLIKPVWALFGLNFCLSPVSRSAVVPIQPSGIDVQSAAHAVRLIKQPQSVRQCPPQALIFLSRAPKETKLKTEAMELLGKLAPTIKSCLNRLFTKNK